MMKILKLEQIRQKLLNKEPFYIIDLSEGHKGFPIYRSTYFNWVKINEEGMVENNDFYRYLIVYARNDIDGESDTFIFESNIQVCISDLSSIAFSSLSSAKTLLKFVTEYHRSLNAIKHIAGGEYDDTHERLVRKYARKFKDLLTNHE